VLFFFMGGSPFALRVRYPLGAYRIPSGGRPSHSISVELGAIRVAFPADRRSGFRKRVYWPRNRSYPSIPFL
jgi:hypothetical protein